MIQDELRTPFRWYDNIDKQSRYLCDGNYKLLSPTNNILPFELKTTGSGASITGWDLYCTDGAFYDYIDSTGGAPWGALYIVIKNGVDYITYNGSGVTGMNLPSGYYYSKVTTNDGEFFSEIFYVDSDIVDIAFVQSVFPLFTAWRWYDNEDKQTRYKENCLGCDFTLLTGNDSLLPFMFKKPSMSNVINSWVLRSIDGDCEHNLDTANLQMTVKGAFDYVYYNGEAIADLPCGEYESIITINGIFYYSEPIKIVSFISSDGDGFYILTEDGGILQQETNDGLLQ